MEKLLYHVLNQVLEIDKDKIDKIGDADQLIEYGLNSLKAIKIMVLIEEELNIRIEAKDISIVQSMTLGNIKKIIEKYSKGK